MLSRTLSTLTGGRLGRSGAEASETQPAHRPSPTSGTLATPWAKTAATPSTVSTRMQDRLKEKRSAHRRLLSARWGRRALYAAGGVAAAWVLLMSPVFAFDDDNLEASGFGTVVDPADVEAIVAESAGTSLVLLNTAHVSDRLEELVGVKEARVERVWPAGLRVTIDSAEPVAAIPVADGTFVLLDESGTQVAEAEAAPEDLPVVNVPVDAENSRILDGVIAVIDEVPVSLRDRIQDVEAQTEDSIHFVLRDGPRVEWGSAEESALKAQVLLVLLEEQADADVIDVSAPTLPTVS
ncbi:cell division protein FtsQ/DivIB [Demequina sp. NBRC 110056]|uniref:cell division protein FtsQ/DivIB n=1 Tax=Demequina sp. NBRC 110056 TaxID=1570345 RepID=UPI001356622F|nr:cell division protein FtsQ/DivIB [Demequina sp. NBRC 110056]